jgi:transglutaminase-like putative cysteine protease
VDIHRKRLALLIAFAGCGAVLLSAFSIGIAKQQSNQTFQPDKPASRTFEFTYSVAIRKLPKGKSLHLWLPMPQTTPEQDVKVVQGNRSAVDKSSMGNDPAYGNKILFLAAISKNDDAVFEVSHTFQVTRREVRRTDVRTALQPGEHEKSKRFLEADKLVPVGGKPLELIKDVKVGPTPMDTARTLYYVVNRHMKYSKEGKGWGNGDAEWACDSKFGNCSDFHSLFISLARASRIPAKFEMGFPIPNKRGEGPIGGYHCWAWFLPDSKGWMPVDISEANRFPELAEYYFGNLSDNRVAFTVGRDITLTPPQKGSALNFFIYPYAELDGQMLPAEQIQTNFSYKDVKP